MTQQRKPAQHSELPSKNCVVCQRNFKWRKKWQRVWEQVKYCGERCRRASRKGD